MTFAPTTILSLLLFVPMILSSSSAAKVVDEEFSEELLLKPLPDRKVLSHFHFQTKAPIHEDSFARHHHLFPKSTAQLVCMHFSLFSPILGLIALLAPYLSKSCDFGP